jgi:hypothetical protein
MNEEQKGRMREWIADLRSDLPQAEGALHVPGPNDTVEGLKKGLLRGSVGLCCLGVGCRRAVLSGLELKIEISRTTINKHDHIVRYADMASYLPKAVIQWYGLEDHSDDPDVQIGTYTPFDSAEGYTTELYPELAAWPGVRVLDDFWNIQSEGRKIKVAASALNDRGVPFKIIADLMERMYLPEDWARTEESRNEQS